MGDPEPGRDGVELQALKQGSVDRYGAEVPNGEEQKIASAFYTLDPDHPDAEPDLTDARVADAVEGRPRRGAARAGGSRGRGPGPWRLAARSRLKRGRR